MITFKQGLEVAKQFDMRYEPPITEYDETTHVFDERRMINSCWVRHTFDLIESVQACIEDKLRIHREAAMEDEHLTEDEEE